MRKGAWGAQGGIWNSRVRFTSRWMILIIVDTENIMIIVDSENIDVNDGWPNSAAMYWRIIVECSVVHHICPHAEGHSLGICPETVKTFYILYFIFNPLSSSKLFEWTAVYFHHPFHHHHSIETHRSRARMACCSVWWPPVDHYIIVITRIWFVILKSIIFGDDWLRTMWNMPGKDPPLSGKGSPG